MQELRPPKNKDNRALRAYQRTSCVWGNRFQIVLSPQYSHKRQSETSPPAEGTGKSKNSGFENKKTAGAEGSRNLCLEDYWQDWRDKGPMLAVKRIFPKLGNTRATGASWTDATDTSDCKGGHLAKARKRGGEARRRACKPTVGHPNCS